MKARLIPMDFKSILAHDELQAHDGHALCGRKTFVRSGIRTHAWRTRLRPERSALDRSAILT